MNIFNTDSISDLPSDVLKALPKRRLRRKGQRSEKYHKILGLMRLADRELAAHEIVVGYWRQHSEVVTKRDVYSTVQTLINDGKAVRKDFGVYKAA